MTVQRLIPIIDDDYAVRNGLSNLLRSAGYEVIGFASAEDFLKYNAAYSVDAIILDVKLAGINGFELLARLANSRPPLPVILISGHGDERMRARAINEGAVAFLRKPIDVDTLLECIRLIVAKGGEPP